MKDKFLRRVVRITGSFNIALWVTTIVVGITAVCVVTNISDEYINNEKLLTYFANIFITALAIMLSFVVVLGVIFLFFTIINGIVKKYLSNQKKSR